MLQENFTFTELEGIPICNKYMTQATIRAMKQQAKRVPKFTAAMFREHSETDQLKYGLYNIKKGDLITITEKVHGTSQRTGKVLVDRSMRHSWLWRQLRRVLGKKDKGWETLTGTRRTVLDPKFKKDGYYGDASFRLSISDRIQPQKGETIYYEVAGYVNPSLMIMPPHSVNLPDVKKKYGEYMVYKYGTDPGQCREFVYCITMTNEDSYSVTMPWTYVMARCKELGLTPVPMLCEPFIFDGDHAALRELVDTLTEGPSTIDSSHIREGVCVLVESANHPPKIYKNKSFVFGVLEGYIKEKADYVDLEESS